MMTGSIAPRQVNARELREQVQRDVQQALREAQEAVAAQRAAAQGGAGGAGGVGVQADPPPPPPPPPEPGRPFRVDAGGRVIDIGPGGVTVARTQEPGVMIGGPQIPPEAVVIMLAFFAMVAFILVGWPIARAIARRMDRSPAGGARLPSENAEQLQRIEQAVEAMAIEVERISEGQRFVTRLLADRQPMEQAHALPNTEPLPAGRDAR